VIRKQDAHKVYPRNTEVIHKGDPRWRSDRENWKGQGLKEDNEYRMASQRHMSNPLSVMDGKIRQAAAREVDYSKLPPTGECELGEIALLPMANGRDMMAFRLVDDERRRWKYAYTMKNGAL